MKVYKSPYTLVPRGRLNAQTPANHVEGCLLKFQDKELVGYSSIQTWPQFGDPSLQELEAKLKSLNAFDDSSDSQIIKNVLAWSKLDATCRLQKKSAYHPSLSELKNNYLLTTPLDFTEDHSNTLLASGYETLKIKMGSNLKLETEALLSNPAFLKFKLRIDFNSSLNKNSAMQWLEAIDPIKNKIDYIEDITAFRLEDWLAIKNQHDIKLAMDHHIHENLQVQGVESCIDFVIIKPFCDDVETAMKWVTEKNKLAVFTSYMDHPLSIMQAANSACVYGEFIATCGLKTTHVYESEHYANGLNHDDCHLKPLPGYGFGFDDLLAAEPWQEIA